MAGIVFTTTAALVLLLAALLLFYRFYFLRKPHRRVPKGDVIVSPADGKVVRILEIGKPATELKKGVLGRVSLLTRDIAKKGYVVVIMMTPLNVHFQRSPLDGTIRSTRHSAGSFRNAVNGAVSLGALENEKNEIVIEHAKVGKIKVVQVAGFLARRIRCFVRKGQKVHKGEQIGLICLGSQVVLVIPRLRLAVREGQRVVDGETVIARF